MVKRLLVVAVMAGMLASCGNKTSVGTDVGAAPSRIVLKERTMVRGYHFFIIEVDGVEYLSNPEGGIIKLDKYGSK